MSLQDTTLWNTIALLPRELKNLIGTYSHEVYVQKQWLRHQFFKQWTIDNLDRLLQLVGKWTKRQITWFMMNCDYFNYTYGALNKTSLIDALKHRIVSYHACVVGKQWLYYLNYARKGWQRLRVIEHVDNTLKERSKERRKAEKRLRIDR